MAVIVYVKLSVSVTVDGTTIVAICVARVGEIIVGFKTGIVSSEVSVSTSVEYLVVRSS